MPADPRRYVVMDSGQTLLFGNIGPARTLDECGEFRSRWQELRAAADPGVLRPAAVYRVEGLGMVCVDAG